MSGHVAINMMAALEPYHQQQHHLARASFAKIASQKNREKGQKQ